MDPGNSGKVYGAWQEDGRRLPDDGHPARRDRAARRFNGKTGKWKPVAQHTGIAYFALRPTTPDNFAATRVPPGLRRRGRREPELPVGRDERGRQGAISATLVGPTIYPSHAIIPWNAGVGARRRDGRSGPGVGPWDGFTGTGEGGFDPRWGDYGAASVAPNGTIWTAAQYIAQRCTFAEWSADYDVRVHADVPGELVHAHHGVHALGSALGGLVGRHQLRQGAFADRGERPFVVRAVGEPPPERGDGPGPRRLEPGAGSARSTGSPAVAPPGSWWANDHAVSRPSTSRVWSAMPSMSQAVRRRVLGRPQVRVRQLVDDAAGVVGVLDEPRLVQRDRGAVRRGDARPRRHVDPDAGERPAPAPMIRRDGGAVLAR